jgi:hypothetical protein
MPVFPKRSRSTKDLRVADGALDFAAQRRCPARNKKLAKRVIAVRHFVGTKTNAQPI